MFRTSFSLIAFAAADKGGDSTPAPAPVETAAEVNEPLVTLTDDAKVDAIKAALRERELFPTVAEAVAKLQNAIAATQPKDKDGKPDEEAPALFGLPIRIKGADSEGNIDESVYAGMRAALAIVGARIDAPAGSKVKKLSGLKAVVIFPIPTVEQFAESEKGLAWLNKIVEKEAAHVFFRNIRESVSTVELSNGMTKAPATIDEYVAEYARGGLDTDTFDALWPNLRKSLTTSFPALGKLLPAKNIVLNAVRSKAYAESHPDCAALESKNMFAKIGLAIIDAAQKNTVNGTASPLPTDTVESWLAERDTFVIAERKADEKDFSVLDNMNIAF